jgi:hypothetical protein
VTVFRALWPITDPTLGVGELLATAAADLPLLARQARVELAGEGRYCVARSATVPGSGNITEWTLLYTCPAVPAGDPALRLDLVVAEDILAEARRREAAEAAAAADQLELPIGEAS